jgi:hypothetical protein
MLLLISRLFLFPGPGLAESAAIDFPSPCANISFTHGSILHKTGLILCPEARSSKTKAARKARGTNFVRFVPFVARFFPAV